MNIKQKASQARNLLADPVLREAIDGLRGDQVKVFTGRAPDEAVIEARHIVWALDALEARLASFTDDEVVFDRRQSKVAPQ
jgi:hypothetical protein